MYNSLTNLLLASILGFCLAGPALAVDPAPAASSTLPTNLVGAYDVKGVHATDKEAYEGVALVSAQGETFEVIYEDSEGKLKGIGLMQGDTFGVAFYKEGSLSLLLFKVESGKLQGRWMDSGDSFVSTETWTRR
ncbi:MAG: hypothetical protein HQL47_07575 [Gammaproteobacteria bacterium]|nr:hypothetical protein [Gammaproteobacteria bacterium]